MSAKVPDSAPGGIAPFVLRGRCVTRALLMVGAGLGLADAAAQLSRYGLGLDRGDRMASLAADLAEHSPLTWYAVVTLALCAALLALVSTVRRRAGAGDALVWASLAGLFGALSLNEEVQLHRSSLFREHVLGPARDRLGAAGGGYVAAALLLGLLLTYRGLFLTLPRAVQIRMGAAGITYAVGALVLDQVGAAYQRAGGDAPLTVSLGVGDELLEMLGVVLFLDALLDYVESRLPTVSIAFGDGTDATTRCRRGRIP